jgi:peptidoglycan/xylan/chitin deacetylase (PgdA/CDA1 family)
MVLAYHNIVESDEPPVGDTSLHLPLREFRDQLDVLESYFEVVPLHILLSREGRGGRPRVSITFDDAYRGSLRFGVPELLARNLPATVFVPPGLLGAMGFWWDLLAEDGPGGLSPEVRSFALEELGGRQGAILDWASSTGRTPRELPGSLRPATEEEVLAAADLPAICLGSHTWNHVNLPRLSNAEIDEELRRPLTWLDRSPNSLRVISYPYGGWSPRLRPSLHEAGYDFGLLIEGGRFAVSRVHSHPLSLPRMNVPRGLSRGGFLARISGVWPL